MKLPNYLVFSQFLVLFLCMLATVACSNDMATSLRKVTYPPDFNYVSPSELRTNMAELAAEMQTLDLALVETLKQSSHSEHTPESGQNKADEQSQRQQVLAALRNMEKIVSRLQAGEAGSSHPFLQDFMRDFANDVGRARIAASLDPPLYYFAGRVSGGCVNCHRVNR
jgi:ABC-type oligopeptide transport system substrate-binding subunit